MRKYPRLSGWALKAITNILIYKRETEIFDTQKRRSQCDHRSRNWSDVATRRGKPAGSKVGRKKEAIPTQSLW